MVSTAGVRCGIFTYTNFLSEALIKQGIGVTILGEYPWPNDSALAKDFKTDVPSFFCWKRNEPYIQLVKESSNYDIIHIQHQYGLFPNEYTFIKFLHELKTPLVVTIHDLVPYNYQMSSYFNEMFVKAKKIIVHTKSCESLLEGWRCPKDKIELIMHGTKLIDVPSKADARKALGLPEDSEIILSWGFIWESKGIAQLIQCLSEIKKTHPKAMLIHAGGIHPAVAGNPSYLQSLFKSAIKLGLTPKDFMVTNWIPEDVVPTWFGAADLIALNYMRGSASASGAGHRIMAGHRPIIKTDDPCLDEVPGFTVPRFDTTALYQGILTVLENKKIQEDLVKQADKVSEESSWRSTAVKHKKLYEKI